jgi:hypothetical protein
LLPETDRIYFYRPDAPDGQQVVAHRSWRTVQQLAGDMMEPQGMYPERWRVNNFPSDDVFRQLAG